MSKVNGEKIIAYNLKTGERDQPMKVTEIRRYKATKDGGKPKYFLMGDDANRPGDFMSRTVGEEMAKIAHKELGIKIVDWVAKVRTPKARGCKAKAQKVLDDCEEKKAERKAAKGVAKPKKKAAAKTAKPATKKAKKEKVTVEVPEDIQVEVITEKKPKKKAAPKKKATAKKTTKAKK
jgi:hypothetical protein